MKKWALVALVSLAFYQPSFATAIHVSKDSYIVGGLLGSIVGFGLGHAVQSRYHKYGWAFTAGEGLGLLSFSTIPMIMRGSGYIGHAPDVISHIGALIFLGFRLWQITDLWVFTQPERPISTELMLERPWQNGWWGAQKEVGVHAVTVPVFRF